MIRLKPPQSAVFRSGARFRILVAGRRFGKTYLALTELCQAAWKPGRLAWYVAPTYKQAKRIAWKPLKQMTRPYWASKPNETDLRIELISGGTICLRGADNYDSLRGDGLDFLVLDEYASIAREAWPEVLRPALADKQGRCLFIGTPRGYNHFYDLYQDSQNKLQWATFQFTTQDGGNVAADELASATHELDERTYRQEFQASFENLTTGTVYYAFDRAGNVQPADYTPWLPLFWSLDFNINPMCSILRQRVGDKVHILDETHFPLRRAADILSRVRSPISSRSNCAKLKKILSVSLPSDVLVLNCWVTATKLTLYFSKTLSILVKSSAGRFFCGERPLPGALLTRKWKGRTLLVEVLQNGFRYENRHYSSLSVRFARSVLLAPR